MKNETIASLSTVLENQISSIDEEKLPQIFSEQIKCLKDANEEYKKAEVLEAKARENVTDALNRAKSLINEAKEVGDNAAAEKHFLWFEWTSTKDEITAIKKNLEEIYDHGVKSAEAQKMLADVQGSLMESQTALLKVQNAQMIYQQKVAEATKFVFGLSAYNMATSQSILIKLKAILSGASEEQLGELAQQQLFMALDQIKNQESIILRLNENKVTIDELKSGVDETRQEIDKIGELDEERDRKIFDNTNLIGLLEKEQKEKDKKNDERFAEIDKSDKKRDKLLDDHGVALNNQAQKDKELESRVEFLDCERNKHDERITANAQKIDRQEESLKKHAKRDAELECRIEEYSKKSAEMLEELRTSVAENANTAKENLDLLEQAFEKQTDDIRSDIREADYVLAKKLENVSAEFNIAISDLRAEIDAENQVTNQRFEEIESRATALEISNNKKVFKIAVATVAGVSLILNILQIIGII